jgi:hypothetical protein
MSHGTQAPPFLPQVMTDGWLHMLPVQQPDAHVCAQPWQALFTHGPPVHATHALPALPHTPFWFPGWQTLFASQQPPGQLAALQTHAPPTHASPAPHAGPLPHLHVLPLQVSAVSASHAPHAPPPVPHVASEGALH